MANLINLFKGKRTVEHPPSGRLTFVRGGWETKTPPPPLDSRGLLCFDAGEQGPSPAQLNAFNALAASYGEWLPMISAKLFAEYQVAQESGYELLVAGSPAAIPGVTRLTMIVVDADCTLTLSYSLYFYHRATQAIEDEEHQLNLILRDGQVVDVLFEG
jgi:hypothetical protein